jgi:hypothetical protein
MPDPISSDPRSLACYPDDAAAEALACVAPASDNSAGLCKAPPAPELSEGSARLVAEYDHQAIRNASTECWLKAAAATGTCARAVAFAIETAPTGVMPLIIGFTSGAACGAQIVETYECYESLP